MCPGVTLLLINLFKGNEHSTARNGKLSLTSKLGRNPFTRLYFAAVTEPVKS